MSAYNHHSQQRSNIYGIQNYSYQTSSSFYQQQQLPTSSYPISNYSPSNGFPSTTTTTTTTLPPAPFYSQEDNLPILDL
jgi:hypothetical protein